MFVNEKILILIGIAVALGGVIIIFNKKWWYSNKEKLFRNIGISIAIAGAILVYSGFYMVVEKKESNLNIAKTEVAEQLNANPTELIWRELQEDGKNIGLFEVYFKDERFLVQVDGSNLLSIQKAR